MLVGDHNQLPPLVVNAGAKRAGLDHSLFRSLSEAHPQVCFWGLSGRQVHIAAVSLESCTASAGPCPPASRRSLHRVLAGFGKRASGRVAVESQHMRSYAL